MQRQTATNMISFQSKLCQLHLRSSLENRLTRIVSSLETHGKSQREAQSDSSASGALGSALRPLNSEVVRVVRVGSVRVWGICSLVYLDTAAGLLFAVGECRQQRSRKRQAPRASHLMLRAIECFGEDCGGNEHCEWGDRAAKKDF
eukprot:61721-Pelagomonas_calceolata.AAC.7